MVRIHLLLLVAVATIGVVESSAQACWWKRHCACGGGASGVANVSGVSGAQSLQTVQSYQTVAAVPMLMASPMFLQGYSGVQLMAASANSNHVDSSEVAELKSSVAGVTQEVQSLRTELVGSLLKELFIPLVQDVLRTRLGVPSPGETKCGGAPAGTSVNGKTGVPVPGGPFGAAEAGNGGGEQLTALLSKLDELIGVLKAQQAGPAEKCEKCTTCEDCKQCEKCKAVPAPAAESTPDVPSSDKVSHLRSSGRVLVSHRTATPSAVDTTAALDDQLQRIERNNQELRRRLDALLPK